MILSIKHILAITAILYSVYGIPLKANKALMDYGLEIPDIITKHDHVTVMVQEYNNTKCSATVTLLLNRLHMNLTRGCAFYQNKDESVRHPSYIGKCIRYQMWTSKIDKVKVDDLPGIECQELNHWKEGKNVSLRLEQDMINKNMSQAGIGANSDELGEYLINPITKFYK